MGFDFQDEQQDTRRLPELGEGKGKVIKSQAAGK